MSEEEIILPELRRTISPVLLRPRPMELGKIKIGGKGREITTRKGSKMRLPVKFDHFIITSRKRDEEGNFEVDDSVHEKIGPSPEHLDIRLMFDSVEDNFQSEMLVYDGKRKVFACDGEVAINYGNKKSGPCQRGDGSGCSCKPFARLAVVLEASSQFGGFHLFRTTSWESVNNIQTTLRLFEAQFGSLRGLPLRMVIYPATDTHEQGMSTSWKVGIVLRADYEEARTAALAFHQADQIERRELKLLSAGVFSEVGETEEVEGEDINEEYLLDPFRRQEVEGIRARETAKAATEQRVEDLKARLAEKRTAVDDGADPGNLEEVEVSPSPLPDFEEDEGTPEEPTEVNVAALMVEFGQFKGQTWGEVFTDPKGPGYVKHFVLEREYDHPSLTAEVKAGLLKMVVEWDQSREEETPQEGPDEAEEDQSITEGAEAPKETPEPSKGPLEALDELWHEGQEMAAVLAKTNDLDPEHADGLDDLREKEDTDGLQKLVGKLKAQLATNLEKGIDPQLGF